MEHTDAESSAPGWAGLDWRPGASLQMLEARAGLLARLRAFFSERGVLEVETPVIARAGATDPHLASLRLAGTRSGYLQTSPEFAMKRLLAAGSGPIYQICKCFRDGEQGRRHNPEFTMLEWYRPGFDHHQLMSEVTELCRHVLGIQDLPRVTYRDLFIGLLGINPHAASAGQLEAAARARLDVAAAMDRSGWLDLLMSLVIEPSLPAAVLVYDFPREQAALSRLDRNAEGELVAQRFELFIGGMELANGYHELTDADELAARFTADVRRRELAGLPGVPIDQHLLAAQYSGLPPCAGVALGVDRLLMLSTGAAAIDEVLSFSAARV